MRLNVRRSITFKLTLLFALASTVVLLLLGYLIGAALERHFEEQDMEVLTGKLQLARHALEKVRTPRELDALPQQLEDSLVGHHGLAVVVRMSNGQTLFATSGADFPLALLDERRPADAVRPTVWKTSDGRPLRGISATVAMGIEGRPWALVAVATDISHHQHFMASFQVTLWWVVILAALLTGFLGWAAAHRSLAPLRTIKQGAAAITATRLEYRLPVDAVPVELTDLVRTLNDMLERLQASFRRLSDFSSDIAHELRTPVSNLLTQTQVTLSKARTTDEYCDILASNAEEFERLSRIIADMLFLAKSDNDLIVPSRETVDLVTEVQSLFEFYEALAEEKNIQLACSGSGVVCGDRLMLRRAINNLLSNAIRHTPAGGRITVRISSDAATLQLAVENTGETIPVEHVSRLFDRFYRVDSSRHRSSEGAGLGLAITRSIVRAHGGDALVRSTQGLTTFELQIPLRSGAQG